MADDTTTQEHLLADVDTPNSTEELGTAEQDASTDVAAMDSKFMTKTNQRIADLTKFAAHSARGKTPQDIMDEDPELARRLARHKDFTDIFVNEDEEPADLDSLVQQKLDEKLGATERERQKREVIRNFRIDGKSLSNEDVRMLNENTKFTKGFDALVQAGYSPEEAFRTTFSTSYPKFAKKINNSASVLAPSSVAPSVPNDGPALSRADREFMNKWESRKDKLKPRRKKG